MNELTIAVTNACDLDCEGCRLKEREEEFIKEDVLEKILHEAIPHVKAKKVLIVGGEPLLHPDIGPMVSLLRKTDCKVYILTNGYIPVTFPVDGLQICFDSKRRHDLDKLRKSIFDYRQNKITNNIAISHSLNLIQYLDEAIQLISDINEFIIRVSQPVTSEDILRLNAVKDYLKKVDEETFRKFKLDPCLSHYCSFEALENLWVTPNGTCSMCHRSSETFNINDIDKPIKFTGCPLGESRWKLHLGEFLN